jgi:16S rRNA (uracil1498-N3)-methyltransferase
VQPRLVVGEMLVGLLAGAELSLPESSARHVQVLRLQPGDEVWVLDGRGLGWSAEVLEMGRKAVTVRLLALLDRDVELPVRVSLVVGVPANDRMDALVEKATELGAWSVRPVLCERSVWRADGARADKKVAHWQGVAQAASEQSGRMVVPRIAAVASLAATVAELAAGLREQGPSGHAVQGHGEGGVAGAVFSAGQGAANQEAQRVDAWFVLDPRALLGWGEALQGCVANGQVDGTHWAFVSGPEGGLSEAEVVACVAGGATPVRLGPRILRADTAPLAVLASVSAALER